MLLAASSARILNPRISTSTASCDVAINICQAVLRGGDDAGQQRRVGGDQGLCDQSVRGGRRQRHGRAVQVDPRLTPG